MPKRVPPKTCKQGLLSILFLVLFAGMPFCPLCAAGPEEAVAQYQQAVRLIEELNVRQDDVFEIIPRVRRAADLLLHDQFETAGEILKYAVSDLEALKTQNPITVKLQRKYAWLELSFDLFLKLIYLFLMAYFVPRLPSMNRMFHEGRVTWTGGIYLSVVFAAAAIFLSVPDISRYGTAAWAFYDIQIVLMTVCGLIGGIVPGILCGIGVGFFRWALRPDAFAMIGLAVMTGAASGWIGRTADILKMPWAKIWAAGTAMGILHGLVICLPMISYLPWHYFLLTAGGLALLEGASVLMFLQVAAAVLRAQRQAFLERDLLKTKLLFLQAQMSPHFLFNALNAISAVCARENAAQAQGLILRLAEFLRGNLIRKEESVTLKEEMSVIDSYLEIEKARFQDRLKIEKQIALDEKDWDFKIPILMLQPLVENAIRHGISKKEAGGTVCLRMLSEKEGILMEVTDDGVGMNIQEIAERREAGESGDKNGGLGIGLQNIDERIARIYGAAYGLECASDIGKGTTIRLRLPRKAGSGRC